MTALSLEPPVYNVGGILYSPTSGAIELDGERSQLRAREANLLHALIQSFPEVLSRTAIEEQLWKDSYATNATINQTVKALRFSLKDDQRTLIRTIPKQGYVLSTKPQVLKQENEEKEEALLLTESVPQKESSTDLLPKQPPLFSLKQWGCIGIATSVVFLAALSGVGATKNERTSQQHGQNWFLFPHSQEELDQVPLLDTTNQQFITKEDDQYRICVNEGDFLQCFNR